MGLLFILPTLVSLYLVIQRRGDKAFLWVYLPSLLLLPQYYGFRFPHLPSLSAAEGALLPIAISVFPQWLKGPRKRMDLWVVLFMASMTASEITQEPDVKDGLLFAANNLISMFTIYIVARQIIEPNLRLPAVKQCVILVLCLLPIAAYEYRMGTNLYTTAAGFFGFQNVGWSVQLRGGRARISASFSDTELAGIAFAVMLALNAWLTQINKIDLQAGVIPRLGRRLAKLERYWVPTAILCLFLYLTQSRGPLLGAGAGLLILQIRRFRNPKLGAIVVGGILTVGALGVYSYYSGIAALGNTASDESQGSAAYRFEMIKAYEPVIAQGGWLGWGALSHPSVQGMNSLDNEYLRVAINYGKLGYILFMIIVAESIWGPLQNAWRFRNREDFLFALSALAALAIMWITIKTVYLGEQLPQLLFLLIGWSQSMKESAADYTAPNRAGLEEPQQEKQLVRVFS